MHADKRVPNASTTVAIVLAILVTVEPEKIANKVRNPEGNYAGLVRTLPVSSLSLVCHSVFVYPFALLIITANPPTGELP